MIRKKMILSLLAIIMVCIQVEANTVLNNQWLFLYTHNNSDIFKNWLVPIFMLSIGFGIGWIWAVDITSGKFKGQGNFFNWKEGESLLWPHILAEYLTSIGLISGAIGIIYKTTWALTLSLLSLGAVIYSCINSTGWVLAKKERISYGIPIWLSFIGAVISIFILT